MANPSIQNGSSRPDLNPAALFQANSAPNEGSRPGFEAALDRARQPESTQKPAEQRKERVRETPEQTAKRPDEATPGESDKASAKEPSTARESTEQSAAPTEQEDAEAAVVTATPAGLPAEIAAILAALAAAAGKGRTTSNADGEPLPDVATGKLTLGTAGEKSAGGNAWLALTTAAGKDSDTTQFGAESGSKPLPQQALALAVQAGGGRNPAEPILQGMRAEGQGLPATQAAHLMFSPRAEQGAQALPQLPVMVAAGQRAWAADVGNQVAWMLGRNESKAELVLTPPSLGKLGVSIHVNGDQTTAHFVAATQAARDALEQALPRLREILQQAGINLGQTNVSTSGDQRAHDGHEGNGHWPRHSASAEDGSGGSTPPASGVSSFIRSGNGVIDTFA